METDSSSHLKTKHCEELEENNHKSFSETSGDDSVDFAEVVLMESAKELTSTKSQSTKTRKIIFGIVFVLAIILMLFNCVTDTELLRSILSLSNNKTVV